MKNCFKCWKIGSFFEKLGKKSKFSALRAGILEDWNILRGGSPPSKNFSVLRAELYGGGSPPTNFKFYGGGISNFMGGDLVKIFSEGGDPPPSPPSRGNPALLHPLGAKFIGLHEYSIGFHPIFAIFAISPQVPHSISTCMSPVDNNRNVLSTILFPGGKPPGPP